jgi:hypothetical protein
MRHSTQLLLALGICFVTSNLCAVTIDTFNVAQTLTAGTGVQDVNTSVTGPALDILGTERDSRLQKIGASSSFANASAGLLSVSIGAASTGSVIMQWDGTADGTKNNIDPVGLSPTDLTDTGFSNAISAQVINGLTPVTMTFTVWAEGGSGTVSSTNAQVIPASFVGAVPFYFSNFSPLVNFSQATAVQMQLAIPQGGSIDVDLIETNFSNQLVPEPGMMCLMLPLLGGLVWRRRRS